ncbi:hypothetical protein [Streptomyces chattanoogensis]|uniref:Uncharacterized protein n=1 Tax=Streptomyces chattanoogensis TaxID=66876 RepID=A0A0N0XWN6_9ACTN|nr:hypothetical protein [Streptomyces chattanoogensis]KPC63994.1 hypothetical protein ADL29_13125 [Streptomyces chattanoogensis]
MSSRSAAVSLAGIGACCALLSAVVHLVIAPEHLEETLYIGILFIIGSVALLLAAAGLVLRNSAAAWWLGALVSGGMILGFALSRTVGLPGYHETDWDPPYGMLSLVAEALFLAAFFAWYVTRPTLVPSAPVRPKVPAGR